MILLSTRPTPPLAMAVPAAFLWASSPLCEDDLLWAP
jgi:hypothetical protein